jgi:hypothetical protein
MELSRAVAFRSTVPMLDLVFPKTERLEMKVIVRFDQLPIAFYNNEFF